MSRKLDDTLSSRSTRFDDYDCIALYKTIPMIKPYRLAVPWEKCAQIFIWNICSVENVVLKLYRHWSPPYCSLVIEQNYTTCSSVRPLAKGARCLLARNLITKHCHKFYKYYQHVVGVHIILCSVIHRNKRNKKYIRCASVFPD